VPPAPSDTALSRLSVLDWIGVLIVAASGAITLLFPLFIGPMFGRLASSLGATGPSVGSWLLQGWVPLLLGVLPLTLVAYALVVPHPLLRRRLLLVIAFALTILASVVLLFAVYGALFAMAGAAGSG